MNIEGSGDGEEFVVTRLVGAEVSGVKVSIADSRRRGVTAVEPNAVLTREDIARLLELVTTPKSKRHFPHFFGRPPMLCSKVSGNDSFLICVSTCSKYVSFNITAVAQASFRTTDTLYPLILGALQLDFA